jgi:acyl carrier protein
MANVEEKIRTIILEHFNSQKDKPKEIKPEDIKPESDFLTDLGADSLDSVELLMAFEDEFNIVIPDEEAMSLRTFGDVILHIEKAKAK